MGLFSFLSKAQKKPYKNEAYNQLYDLLFCDDLDLFRTEDSSKSQYPWSILLSSSASAQDIQKVASDTSMESRQRILAYRAMASKGLAIHDKHLLGIVIEVGLEEGLDVLAAYNDGTARYFNYSEKLTVWEAPSPKSNALINQLLTQSLNTANQIGLWDKPRLHILKREWLELPFFNLMECHLAKVH